MVFKVISYVIITHFYLFENQLSFPVAPCSELKFCADYFLEQQIFRALRSCCLVCIELDQMYTKKNKGEKEQAASLPLLTKILK